ncbi:DJ-1 domain InhA-type [Penicillium bovifimosum]|uniref:DJ-1 domain InhA-type n=1 Tax=Penicillium bovifimosum TaxID=126998 RepID=A0A9W9GWB9_9EURO|nr:DJ-1 domain InhA-type [Penicillium bovifimosum]KAJ5130419.1 DJ-1 domain InhA-type [Penicillium bovifimosum]
MSPVQKKALVVIFPGFNILDVSGPVSVLFNSDFAVSYAAKDELTTSQENMIVRRNISFAEAKLRMDDYEILIVPGSRPTSTLPLLQTDENDRSSEIIDFISGFASDLGHNGVRQRTVLSVCIGAYFLAAAGVLDGLVATTHRLAVPGLRIAVANYVERHPGAKGTKIVPESPSDLVPYMDAGRNPSGVRVITSGPMVHGIDAALHFVSLSAGRSVSVEIAELIGHHWREM